MKGCADCRVHVCRTGKMDKAPEACPTLNDKELIDAVFNEYQKKEINNIALNAARVEAKGYGIWTRVEEIMEFSKRAGFKKLGLAFCVGLRREARTLIDIWLESGFEVAAAACKMGANPKEKLGIKDEEKVRPGEFEAMCNPIAQANFLNNAEVDLKVIMGLCVGHDTLFIQYAKGPVTVMAVKDRVLAHNPVAALYCRGSYYNKKLSSHHL